MNTRKLQELRTQYILGIINDQQYDRELDKLLELTDDEEERQIINSYKDRDI